MNTLFTAIKGMLWGLFFLIFLSVAFLSADKSISNFKSFLPSDIHEKVANLTKVIGPKLNKLEPLDFSYRSQDYQNIKIISDEIRKDIQVICGDCQLTSFYVSSGWEVSSYGGYLERRMTSEATKENNQTYAISGASAALCLLLSLYGVWSLIKLRKNSLKLSFLIVFLTPIFFFLEALSNYQMNDKYFFPQFGYDGKGFTLLAYSFLSIFLLYPSLYAVISKKSISFKEIFLLKP